MTYTWMQHSMMDYQSGVRLATRWADDWARTWVVPAAAARLLKHLKTIGYKHFHEMNTGVAAIR